MSIFKDTFKGPIKKQLDTRQLAMEKRDATAIKYLNTRTAWVKMTSAVNVNGNNDIASNYVLFGGTLFGASTPKSGVGPGIDRAYSLNTGLAKHRLGIRPMPGITGIEVKTKSAYGSLMEATINYVCWDIKQLEELELLYMRPNYSVLLEWGWAPYLKSNYTIATPSEIPFNTSVLAGGKTKEQIWKEIYDASINSEGNYNALYGFIKNYSWSARADGGYDCTTTLITMGELIESLKINWVPATTSVAFERGTFNVAGEDNFKTDGALNKAYQRSYLAGLLYEIYVILKDEGKIKPKTYQKYEFEDSKGKFDIGFYAYEFKAKEQPKSPEGGEPKAEDFTSEPLNIYIQFEGFIRLFNHYVILHAGEPQSSTQTPIVEISLKEGFQHGTPGKDLMYLGHPYQISMDPTVCLVYNPEFGEQVKAAASAASAGDDRGFFDGDTEAEDAAESTADTVDEILSGFEGQGVKFLSTTSDGSYYSKYQNIFVNLAFLYRLATDDGLSSQDKSEKKDIALFDFLKSVINGLNISLGAVNNIDIHVDPSDSVARIIDVNYVDEKSKDEAYKALFELKIQDTNALNSIVRSYKLESQIFQEQASVVAIGAQAKGGALASGDNTLVDFNQNLTDRIIPAKEIQPAINKEKNDTEKLTNLKTNLTTIAEYFSSLDDGTAISRFFGGGAVFDKTKSSQYTNALKDIIAYTKSLTPDPNNNKAIIPTKFSFDMDGIGGIIIGSMFRINPEVLPKGYKGDQGVGARIAYLVTSVQHSIGDNNDWKTSLGAQFIIMDGENKGITKQDLNKALSAITAKTIERAQSTTQQAGENAAPTANETPSGETPKANSKYKAPKSADVKKNLDAIERACIKAGYTNKFVIIAVKANCLKECGGQLMAENLVAYSNTSNERIRTIFGARVKPYNDAQLTALKRNVVEFSDVIYGLKAGSIGKQLGNTQPGDGYKYRGRGFIQTTGRAAYTSATNDINSNPQLYNVKNVDFVNNPDSLIANIDNAAAAMISFFRRQGFKFGARHYGLDPKNPQPPNQAIANQFVTCAVAGGGKKISRPPASAIFQEILAKVDSYSTQVTANV